MEVTLSIISVIIAFLVFIGSIVTVWVRMEVKLAKTTGKMEAMDEELKRQEKNYNKIDEKINKIFKTLNDIKEHLVANGIIKKHHLD